MSRLGSSHNYDERLRALPQILWKAFGNASSRINFDIIAWLRRQRTSASITLFLARDLHYADMLPLQTASEEASRMLQGYMNAIER